MFTFGGLFEKFQFDNSFNLGGHDKFDAPPYYGTFTIPDYGRLSVDLLSVGNLLNSDRGLVQVPTSVQPIVVMVTRQYSNLYFRWKANEKIQLRC